MLTEGPTAAEAEAVTAHFHYLSSLTEQGVVLLAGRTLNIDPSSFGIVIFDAPDDEAAQALVDGDPSVQQRVMRAELFPYAVALFHPALGDDPSS